MNRKLVLFRVCAAAALLVSAVPLSANLIITPTFDSSITGDPNAAAIEGVINSAIGVYESTFTNPINVSIVFKECSGACLGSSSFDLEDVSYQDFSTALAANAQSPDQQAAVAANPISNTNPVTGTDDILMKCAEYNAVFGVAHSGCSSDGTISLNTQLTFPGTPGTSGQYYLMAVTEHEIDEILGLGSTLVLNLSGTCGTIQPNDTHPCSNVPSPEDLFRYDSQGNRSFTTNGTADAFFSITGAVDLDQFDNRDVGGDFGDWQGGAIAQVQDSFATPGATPGLNVEITALNVIGYDLAAPEPGTAVLMAGALLGLIGLARRRY